MVALSAGKVVFDGPPSDLDRAKLIDIYGPEFEDVAHEGLKCMNRRAMLSGTAALALAANGKTSSNTVANHPRSPMKILLNFSVLAVENATSVEEWFGEPVLADLWRKSRSASR